MKTKFLFLACLGLLITTSLKAQNRTTVNATSSEISDNLDLRAVASVFGESRDLEDFEQRLNNPELQLSNLDLNNDNQVDYLRVIETIEGNAHIIVIQSVLGRDVFQDVATVEVQKTSNNRVQVQVVGDVFMYGNNYIYEPVYVSTPIIYNYFYTPRYHPYASIYYWDYYPNYYSFWQPYAVFRYQNNIGVHINFYNSYNYVNTRHCVVAYNNYYGRRANWYERQHPNQGFNTRNSGYVNRYEYDRSRNRKDVAYNANNRNSRNTVSNSSTRNYNNTNTTRNSGTANTSRNNSSTNVNTRNTTTTRSQSYLNGSNTPTNYATTRNNGSNATTRQASPNTRNSTSRVGSNSSQRSENTTRNFATRPIASESRSNSVRVNSNSAQRSESTTRNYSQNSGNKAVYSRNSDNRNTINSGRSNNNVRR